MPLLTALLAILPLLLSPPHARGGEALIEAGELARTVSVEDLKLDGDRISGLLVNRTDKTVRDVRLQIGFSWLWKNERHPGDNDPSFTVTEIPPGEIAPRGTMPFSYIYPSVVTSRTDGQYMFDARVLGYSAVSKTQVMVAPTTTP